MTDSAIKRLTSVSPPSVLSMAVLSLADLPCPSVLLDDRLMSYEANGPILWGLSPRRKVFKGQTR